MKNIILLATRNKGKLQEIQDLLRGEGYLLYSLIDYPQIPPIDETSNTLEDNARRKAVETARLTGTIALADDSSLEIEALSGKPGVNSARFLGAQATDWDRNLKVLELMKDFQGEERKARFRCVIALARPDGSYRLTEGEVWGFIADRPRGQGGFGYDSIFYLPAYQKTMAELEPALKNQISHRAVAVAKAKRILREMTAQEVLPDSEDIGAA